MRRPFMTDPDQLASLEGQQYLVLRPAGAVSTFYRETQAELLRTTPRPLKHPHTEHVTLRGFYEADRLDALAALIREWGAQQHPIDVTIEAVDTFPEPWQIVIMRLARTAPLVAAYASLSSALEGSDFRRLGEMTLDDWIFHLSVVYGKTLTQEDWAELARAAHRVPADQSTCLITEAELVSYSGGVERVEIIPLG